MNDPDGLLNTCDNYFHVKIMNYTMQIVGGLITLITNAIMKFLLVKLQKI